MRTKTSVLLLLVLVFTELDSVPPAYAAPRDCISGPCIDLTTDPITGEIVGRGISIDPGSAANRATVNKTRTAKKKKPAVIPVVNPICTIAQLAAFTCIKSASQAVVVLPVVKVTPPKPTVITTDEVRRALPQARLGFQPISGSVVNVPVIFWSGVSTPARFSLVILGHLIQVEMSAQFHWSWGDGTYLTTRYAGAPFPSQDLTHTYSHPGNYRISMTTTWSGSATLGQASIQIVGSPIETVDQITVNVGQAPTLLTTLE